MRRGILILGLLVLRIGAAAPALAQTSSPFGTILPGGGPTEGVDLAIAQVDNNRLVPPLSATDSLFTASGKPIEAGWMATVQGTITNRDYQVFVLVHPLLQDVWTVQSTVARPSKTGVWRTTCLLGTERKGKDEDYEVIAVASAKRDQYRPGQRIPANQFPPPDMPQSETVLIRRVRSPGP